MNTETRRYAAEVMNNLNAMLNTATRNENGTAKGMTDAVWVGVMTAQSNMAIAAALLAVAEEIREFRP